MNKYAGFYASAALGLASAYYVLPHLTKTITPDLPTAIVPAPDAALSPNDQATRRPTAPVNPVPDDTSLIATVFDPENKLNNHGRATKIEFRMLPVEKKRFETALSNFKGNCEVSAVQTDLLANYVSDLPDQEDSDTKLEGLLINPPQDARIATPSQNDACNSIDYIYADAASEVVTLIDLMRDFGMRNSETPKTILIKNSGSDKQIRLECQPMLTQIFCKPFLSSDASVIETAEPAPRPKEERSVAQFVIPKY